MVIGNEKMEDEGALEPMIQAGQTEEAVPHDHGLVERDEPSYVVLKTELEEAKRRAEELSNQVLRAHAELQNVQRARERDVAHAHRYALDKFLGALLPVVDSLENAVTLGGEMNDAFSKGVGLTLKMILETLKKFGVESINPMGEVFDPTFHEAMTIQEDSTVAENTVLSVFQKGYMLNGRLLRPARVLVSKHSNEAALPDGL